MYSEIFEYSFSIVETATVLFNLEYQLIGPEFIVIMNPMVVSGSPPKFVSI